MYFIRKAIIFTSKSIKCWSS